VKLIVTVTAPLVVFAKYNAEYQPPPKTNCGRIAVAVAAWEAPSVRLQVWEMPLALAVNCTVTAVVTVAAVAPNVLLLAPGKTVTNAGTVRFGLLLLSETVTPPAGAAAVRLTVHRLTPAETSAAGTQVSPASCAGPCEGPIVRLNVWETPLAVAVNCTVTAAVTVPAVATKVALLLPAGTVTDPGTVRFALLLLSETVTPPPDAAAVRLTVQVLVPAATSEPGTQLSPASCAGPCEGTTVRLKVCELPFRLAVSCTVIAAVTVAAVITKLTLLLPAGTVTDPGTVRFGLLLLSETVRPPPGAAAVRLTVQVPAPAAASDAGLQLSWLSAGCPCVGMSVTPTPLPMMGIPVPPAAAATVFVSWMAEEELLVTGEIWNVATATTPFAIRLAFVPTSRQVAEPDCAAQEIDLPAAAAAGPATTCTDTKSVTG